ncbi:MAG: hypothetical protein LUG54_03725 [Clostridiales bacterium]|nr:hypothetical protein [Clostridiales bacterium]
MLLGLTACEESLAFVETHYWHDTEEIDYDVQQMDNDEENEEEDEEIFSRDERDDSEQERYYDYAEDQYDDSAEETQEQAPEPEYVERSAEAGESQLAETDAEETTEETGGASITEGSTEDSDEVLAGNDTTSESSGGSGVASGDGEGDVGESIGSTNDKTEAGIDTDDEDDEEPEEDLKIVENDGGDEQIEDGGSAENDSSEEQNDNSGGSEAADTGSSSEPEDENPVVACGAVIATGEAAILTQMLGGEGALYATDQATYTAMAEYFPADELEDIEILWSGDSTGTLDADSLDALIAEGKTPQAALLDATALNEEDVTALSSRGISCTALQFDSYEDILSSVNAAAAVLGTDQASEMRDAYVSFCSGMEDLVGDYDSQKWTLFVSEWDSTAQLVISSVGFKSRYGIAIASRLLSSPVDDMWDMAGIVNNYGDYNQNYRKVYGAGANQYIWGSTQEYLYLNQLWVLVMGGTMTIDGVDVGNIGDSSVIEGYGNALLWGLGASEYPAVIVDSQEIQESWTKDMNYSSSTQDGGMYTKYAYYVGIAEGRYLTMGGGEKTSVGAYIEDEYEIYVNPSGLGDWAGGSAESILEAVWTAWKIQGTCTEDQVREKIREYYATFYRCTDLTDAQVDAILAGKES